jgi:endonuclease YncB( thermonuclease family)
MTSSEGRHPVSTTGQRRALLGALMAAAAILAAPPSPASGQNLAGPVTHVGDGDTIEVSGVPVRLSGVTADELGTARGEAAASFMRDIVRGEIVSCALTGEVTHDRQVGRCSVDGQDLGKKLIAARLAGRCTRYDPDGFYRRSQQDAGPYVGLMPSYCMPR